MWSMECRPPHRCTVDKVVRTERGEYRHRKPVSQERHTCAWRRFGPWTPTFYMQMAVLSSKPCTRVSGSGCSRSKIVSDTLTNVFISQPVFQLVGLEAWYISGGMCQYSIRSSYGVETGTSDPDTGNTIKRSWKKSARTWKLRHLIILDGSKACPVWRILQSSIRQNVR